LTGTEPVAVGVGVVVEVGVTAAEAGASRRVEKVTGK